MTDINALLLECQEGIESAIKTAVDVIETESGLKVSTVSIDNEYPENINNVVFKARFTLKASS